MKKLLTALLMYLCIVATPLMAQQVIFGVIPAGTAHATGLIIGSVHTDTPADIAGLLPADIITGVDAISINSAADLKRVLATCAPGDVVRVKYLRGGEPGIALVELAARPTAEHHPMKIQATMSPELHMQFIQAKSRLRVLLSRLPQYAELAALTADVNEMLTLARSLPSSPEEWMQGNHVEVSVRFSDSAGSIILHAVNNSLELELLTPQGESIIRTNINNRQDCTELPSLVRQRLQQL